MEIVHIAESWRGYGDLEVLSESGSTIRDPERIVAWRTRLIRWLSDFRRAAGRRLGLGLLFGLVSFIGGVGHGHTVWTPGGGAAVGPAPFTDILRCVGIAGFLPLRPLRVRRQDGLDMFRRPFAGFAVGFLRASAVHDPDSDFPSFLGENIEVA